MQSETLKSPEGLTTATELMTSFAQRTGVTGTRRQIRYLWTDAFAVCNFLGLARATGDERYEALALRLIQHVHETLGRHRADDARKGFISGLTGDEAAAHPTAGGLRIGKELPEPPPGNAVDERLDWDRDGQYFHYLVKWMHALDQAARWTEDPSFNVWARELGDKAFDAFTYTPAGSSRPRMYWKMSIDLSRPLVRSMGQHDPLDGFVTYLEVQTTASTLSVTTPGKQSGPDLGPEAQDFASMLEGQELGTSDPLGLGGLLFDAFRLTRLAGRATTHGGLVERLLRAAHSGLTDYVSQRDLRSSAAHRLAFRELGLAIGLHALAVMRPAAAPDWQDFFAKGRARAELAALMPFLPLRERIEAFWLEPEHRREQTWAEHRDINEVMLATSLVPAGFLGVE